MLTGEYSLPGELQFGYRRLQRLIGAGCVCKLLPPRQKDSKQTGHGKLRRTPSRRSLTSCMPRLIRFIFGLRSSIAWSMLRTLASQFSGLILPSWIFGNESILKVSHVAIVCSRVRWICVKFIIKCLCGK